MKNVAIVSEYNPFHRGHAYQIEHIREEFGADTRIVAIMSTAAHQARETIKTEKRNGTLVNACGRKPAESAVFLYNGTVIASPLTVNRILGAIERSNAKQVKSIQANETRRLKVYEAIDESPDEENDQEWAEISTELE